MTVRRGNEYHIKNSMRDGAADQVTNYGRADDACWSATGTGGAGTTRA
ncbi:hypothetical protein [Georgenia sp. SUBG003]